ncbi:unnamed protein product [Effrenium voratum]|uniref:Uncharacterized protein n=1 Tax=Effrenium voratum TaxID=2562239 RepID=A0AA36N3P3_9DINO|nr:unnamed protein product [Effrenium voratum]
MSMPWLRCTALALLSRCDIAVSVEQIDDESCPVQLLQVSQALDGPGPWEAIRDLVREAGRAESAAVLAPATVADGAAEDARKALQSAGAENFLQDLGRAEQAALAEPSRVPAKTVESALPGFEKPAMVQQSAQTQTSDLCQWVRGDLTPCLVRKESRSLDPHVAFLATPREQPRRPFASSWVQCSWHLSCA